VLPLESGDALCRILGSPADVTAAVVRAALVIAGRWSNATNSAPWLLDSHALAANHWFSTVPEPSATAVPSVPQSETTNAAPG
jgi:hypothetical protein